MLAVGAIALGQFTLIFVHSLMAGFFQDILQTISGPMLGHVQIHHPDWREERAVDLYLDDLGETCRALLNMPEVERVSPRIYAFALVAPGEKTDAPADAEPGMIVGLDMSVERGAGGILEGIEQNTLPGIGEVAVGSVLATRLGIREGRLLALIGQDADGFPISELYAVKTVIHSNVDLINTMGIIMPLNAAGELLVMPDKAHEICVYGRDFHDADLLRASVARLPALRDASVMTWRETLPQVTRLIDINSWFNLIFMAIVFIAAAAGIANTALMSTLERKNEFGMLLAVGARPQRIIAMVLTEAVILGLIGVAVGSVLGMVIVDVSAHTGIDYAALGGGEAESITFQNIRMSYRIYPRFEWSSVYSGVVAVTLTSIVASLWPALLAARLEPVEAMRS